jgi:hypothetical protein
MLFGGLPNKAFACKVGIDDTFSSLAPLAKRPRPKPFSFRFDLIEKLLK